MSFQYARGFNPSHGFDSGPAPPAYGFGGSGMGGFPNYGTFGGYPGFQQPFYGPQFYPQQPFGLPFPFYNQGQAHPAPPNPPDGGIPGIHLKNHVGGIGMEPGYNYIFPDKHCKIHVFKTENPPWEYDPWQLSPFDNLKHAKLMVPVSTTIKDFMQNIGCNNPEAGENVMHEISEAGNGKWVKGLTFKGDNKDRMKKTIGEWGWNMSRTGKMGEAPVVWCWATKGKS